MYLIIFQDCVACDVKLIGVHYTFDILHSMHEFELRILFDDHFVPLHTPSLCLPYPWNLSMLPLIPFVYLIFILNTQGFLSASIVQCDFTQYFLKLGCFKSVCIVEFVWWCSCLLLSIKYLFHRCFSDIILFRHDIFLIIWLYLLCWDDGCEFISKLGLVKGLLHTHIIYIIDHSWILWVYVG